MSPNSIRCGGVLLNRVQKLAAKVFQQILASRGAGVLPPGQGRILFALLQGDGISLKELSARTGLDKSGLSLTLDRMARSGLLRRTPSRDDGRGIVVTLADGMRKMQRIHEEVSAEMVEIFYRGFTGEEIDQFEQSLARILGNLGQAVD